MTNDFGQMTTPTCRDAMNHVSRRDESRLYNCADLPRRDESRLYNCADLPRRDESRLYNCADLLN
jgi:hypothetical protein